MASAKKCDRCGLLYEETNKMTCKDKSDLYFKGELLKIFYPGALFSLDLCKDCYLKLVKFMKMED